MQTSRWCFVNVLALAITAGAWCGMGEARAQAYPAKPVRILVALGPGSATDVLVRTVASRLSERWGQPIVIENRAGGAGAMAGSVLVKSAPDGYTLMAYSDGHTINAALNASLPYDTLRDIARVSRLGSFPTVLVAAPSLGVTTVKQLIDHARANPGRLSFGSAGIGGGMHLSGEMFNLAAGIEGTHVPYKSPIEALTDVMAGRVHYAFSPIAATLPLIASGKVVPLAVGSAQRSTLLPDLPTVAEAALPGFEHDLWAGLFAPTGTPRPVLERISKDVAAVMSLPDVKEQLTKLGFTYRENAPDEFDRQVRSEVEQIAAFARRAGIRLQ